VKQAEILGNAFDHVIIYEDKCTRGRADGEVVALMRRGLAQSTRVTEIFETRGEFRAIEAGLRMLKPRDLILVQADQVEEALHYVQRHIAGERGESAVAIGWPS
jgi:cyanophycin synthetase